MAAASALTGFSRSAVVCALSSFLATPYAAQTIGSTFRAGDARPVTRLASPAGRAADIDLLSFDFQQPYFGFEGPGLFPIDGEPSRGARYIVAASLYSEKSIATAAFSAVDERGTVIQSIRMMRQPNGSDTSELVGLMVVPDRPFRIVMTGAAVDGVPYRRTYKRLFRPTQEPPSGRQLPPDVPTDLATHMTQIADEAARQVIDRLDNQLANHPEGVVFMPRTEISNVAYAPLFSAAGRPIGPARYVRGQILGGWLLRSSAPRSSNVPERRVARSRRYARRRRQHRASSSGGGRPSAAAEYSRVWRRISVQGQYDVPLHGGSDSRLHFPERSKHQVLHLQPEVRDPRVGHAAGRVGRASDERIIRELQSLHRQLRLHSDDRRLLRARDAPREFRRGRRAGLRQPANPTLLTRDEQRPRYTGLRTQPSPSSTKLTKSRSRWL